MDTEDLAFDHSSNSEVVEDLCAILPWICISIFSNSLIIETIHGSDLSSLMVSSKQGNMRWVLKLEAEQELECLNRVEASIHKVTHEDVPCFWDLSTFVEKFQEIMELSMDISTDSNWCFDRLDITLFYQDFLYFFAENS